MFERKSIMKNRKSYFKFIVLFFILLSVANVSGSNNDITNVTAAKVCSHPYYIRYGEGKYVKVSYSNDSTYCYKTSFKYKQKCGICAQKISQPSYDAWKKHKHDYGFFNLKKNCKECGYQK